jgi:hypothetical protein
MGKKNKIRIANRKSLHAQPLRTRNTPLASMTVSCNLSRTVLVQFSNGSTTALVKFLDVLGRIGEFDKLIRKRTVNDKYEIIVSRANMTSDTSDRSASILEGRTYEQRVHTSSAVRTRTVCGSSLHNKWNELVRSHIPIDLFPDVRVHNRFAAKFAFLNLANRPAERRRRRR